MMRVHIFWLFLLFLKFPESFCNEKDWQVKPPRSFNWSAPCVKKIKTTAPTDTTLLPTPLPSSDTTEITTISTTDVETTSDETSISPTTETHANLESSKVETSTESLTLDIGTNSPIDEYTTTKDEEMLKSTLTQLDTTSVQLDTTNLMQSTTLTKFNTETEKETTKTEQDTDDKVYTETMLITTMTDIDVMETDIMKTTGSVDYLSTTSLPKKYEKTTTEEESTYKTSTDATRDIQTTEADTTKNTIINIKEDSTASTTTMKGIVTFDNTANESTLDKEITKSSKVRDGSTVKTGNLDKWEFTHQQTSSSTIQNKDLPTTTNKKTKTELTSENDDEITTPLSNAKSTQTVTISSPGYVTTTTRTTTSAEFLQTTNGSSTSPSKNTLETSPSFTIDDKIGTTSSVQEYESSTIPTGTTSTRISPETSSTSKRDLKNTQSTTPSSVSTIKISKSDLSQRTKSEITQISSKIIPTSASEETSHLPNPTTATKTTTSKITQSQQPSKIHSAPKTRPITSSKSITTHQNKKTSRQEQKTPQQTEIKTETTPISVTLLDRKTRKPVEVNFLLTTPILKEMMTDSPPECPNGMVAGNYFCYGITPRNTTFMEQMFGCKLQYGKKAQLVPEYALYDYNDQQIILNMIEKFGTTQILVDPEGGPLLRDNKLAVVRDLNEFPWRNVYSEHPKKLVGLQESLKSVANICRLPKHNGFPDCSTGSLFTVFGLNNVVKMPKKNNTMYKTGSTLSIHCKNPSTYVPVWNLKCMAGWWSPSPEEIQCKIKRGTPYEPKPSGFYQPYVKDCSICWETGTESCIKIEKEKGKYKCICKKGYEGFHCEGVPQYCGNDKQAADFCNRHGKCYNNITGPVCECHYGWGDSHCTFDRRKFEWNRYGYYSGTQISSTLESIALYIYVIYRIIDTKLNHEDTRMGTIKTARTWAELAYIIVFSMHRKPQILGLSNATCDLFYTLTHGFAMTVQLYYVFECLTYMGVKMCWHRNVWSNWDDRDLNSHRARNVIIYLGIPFYVGLLTPFFITLHIAGDYSLAEDWSCVGRLENVHSRPVLAILVSGGIYMIIASFIMWSTDNFERESDSNTLKRHTWFIHFAPLEVEFTQKITRQSFPLKWLPKLFFAQYLTGILAVTYPEWIGIDLTYVTISFTYFLVYTYHSLQSDSRRWKWLCTWLMIKLPKRFSPKFNPMTFMTREETLAWKKPDLFWKEIREEVIKEVEEEEKERKKLLEKRNRLIQNYPDLPANLLPHIPEQFDDKVSTLEEKIKARADEKLKYRPFNIKHFNEFFPMYLQEVIQLNIIKNYVGDRMKRKGSMSVMDTVVHFGLIEYDYWKNLYVHYEDGNRSRVALEQLTAIVGETIMEVVKNDWNRYRREHSNNVKKDKELRQKNPGLYHYLKGKKFVKPWFPDEIAIDDRADDLYKKIMEQISYRQCQGMPHACEYGNMMQRFANIERARQSVYITRFPYIRSLRTWNERLHLQKVADEDTNTNWEKVYENDTWFENLTDYQKDALRSEYKIHKPDKKGEYMNPRKLDQNQLFDSFWEWRKPTFIGPREKKCYTYPELGHPLCSHAKRWCEEADEFEFTNYIETQQAPFEEARADGQSYVDYEEANRREEMHIPNPGDHGISPPEWALKYIKKRTRSPNRFH